MRREFDTLFRTQADRVLRDLDLVQREEFEAVKEMARLAREQNEALEARIAALEAKLAATAWPPRTQPGAPGQSPGGPVRRRQCRHFNGLGSCRAAVGHACAATSAFLSRRNRAAISARVRGLRHPWRHAGGHHSTKTEPNSKGFNHGDRQ